MEWSETVVHEQREIHLQSLSPPSEAWEFEGRVQYLSFLELQFFGQRPLMLFLESAGAAVWELQLLILLSSTFYFPHLIRSISGRKSHISQHLGWFASSCLSGTQRTMWYVHVCIFLSKLKFPTRSFTFQFNNLRLKNILIFPPSHKQDTSASLVSFLLYTNIHHLFELLPCLHNLRFTTCVKLMHEGLCKQLRGEDSVVDTHRLNLWKRGKSIDSKCTVE